MMGKTIYRVFILFNLLYLPILISCNPTAIRDLPESEREKIMTHTFQAEYDKVFNSIITVLEKEGFIINSTDRESGIIITDYYEIEDSKQVFFLGMVSRKKVNARVSKLNELKTKVRLNLIYENKKLNSNTWTRAIYRIDSKKEWDEYFVKIRNELY